MNLRHSPVYAVKIVKEFCYKIFALSITFFTFLKNVQLGAY